MSDELSHVRLEPWAVYGDELQEDGIELFEDKALILEDDPSVCIHEEGNVVEEELSPSVLEESTDFDECFEASDRILLEQLLAGHRQISILTRVDRIE